MNRGLSLLLFVGIVSNGDAVLLDERFRPQLTTNHRVLVVETADARKLLVGGYVESSSGINPFVVRLKRSGRIDRTFRADFDADQNISATPIVNLIRQRSDGLIAISGRFSRISSHEVKSVAVLRRNGSLEPRYVAEVGPAKALLHDGTAWANHDQTGRFYLYRTVKLDAWGKEIEVVHSGTPLIVHQVLPNDSVLGAVWDVPRYVHFDFGFFTEWQGSGQHVAYMGTLAMTRGASNSVYVADHNLIRRFMKDWRPDPTFKVPFSGASIALCALPDGRLVFSVGSSLSACDWNGVLDSSFSFPDADGAITGLLLVNDDELLAWGNFTRLAEREAPGVVRIRVN
jgi:hypothetical protein